MARSFQNTNPNGDDLILEGRIAPFNGKPIEVSDEVAEGLAAQPSNWTEVKDAKKATPKADPAPEPAPADAEQK